MYGIHQMASPAGHTVKYTDDSIRIELAGHANEQAAGFDRPRIHGYDGRTVSNDDHVQF
jgi:hypothetical protein